MEDVKVKRFLQVDGSGYGSWDGSGSGYGSWDGSGGGSGGGSGDGSGYGSGDGGLAEINGHTIYMADNTPTIFTHIHGNVAKGFILQSDLTMTPCYVVKGHNQFAHGDNLHDAMEALTAKMFDGMPEEERIAEFIKAHPDPEKAYPHKDLFDWHNRLTGSCLAGRNAFVKDHGLDMDRASSVKEFIRLTENSYGGSTIKALKKAYEEGEYGKTKPHACQD